MKNYTVNFLVRDVVSVEVNAENAEEAENKAKDILDKELYKSRAIECVDGSTTFAGFNINDVWGELNSYGTIK